ncbi:MAG TPA: RluA family pseudouridine synthase [Bacillota bacterium]|nr:RluA family pseudouridine synthase [Bacillota bacterium]
MSTGESYIFLIDEEHAGRRIDSVLSLLMEEASRSYIQKLIEEGMVKVDGSPVFSKKLKLLSGRRVELFLPRQESGPPEPEPIELEVLYEDEDLAVINKPKGMVVHPGAGNANGTLVNALLHRYGKLSSLNGEDRPGIVHRIDKDTSGLLVIARTDAALRGLAAQFAKHGVSRSYIAVVRHRLAEPAGTIDAPIGRDPKNRLRMAVVKGGRRAVTHYELLEEYSSSAMVRARLETGRTHQIRVHFAHIKHPLLGDSVYGPAKQPYGLGSQLLHAQFLGFVHPIKDEYMEFSAPLPQDFEKILEKLRKGI